MQNTFSVCLAAQDTRYSRYPPLDIRPSEHHIKHLNPHTGLEKHTSLLSVSQSPCRPLKRLLQHTHIRAYIRAQTRGSASRKDWPLLRTHPGGEVRRPGTDDLHHSAPRRHDILCDGGAIGNDGNKCETVTPRHPTPTGGTCMYPVSFSKVVRSRLPSKIRSKSSRPSLAIKYKKQLHWRSASAFIIIIISSSSSSSNNSTIHQQGQQQCRRHGPNPSRVALPGRKAVPPQSCAVSIGVSDTCPPARRERGGGDIPELALDWPCCLSICLLACLPETSVLRDTYPSAKAGMIFLRMRTRPTPTHQSLILTQPTDRPLAGARELVLPQQGRHGTMGTLSRLTHTHT